MKAKLQRVQGRWQELYDATGGSPLALVHTLGLMRVRVTLDFDGALAMLRRGAARGSPLQEFIYQEARRELGTGDVAALSALSFFVPSATFEALMAVADLSRTALETVLERLDALSLVNQELGEERYSLHPLTRAYVRDELLADANTVGETGMRFARYWVDYAERYGGSSRNYATFNRLEAEWPNLEEAANWLWTTASAKGDEGEDRDAARLASKLANALFAFLRSSGRWDECMQWDMEAYNAAAMLADWEAAMYHAVGVLNVQFDRGRIDDAVLWMEKTTETIAQLEDTEFAGFLQKSFSRWLAGLIALQRKDYDRAARLMQEAEASMRDFFPNQAPYFSLYGWGMLYHECKAYDVAERFYKLGLEQARKEGDKHDQAEVMNSLGKLALDRKRWSKARQWYEQALALAREVGQVELIAQAQYGLARVWEAEGQADMALPLAQEALAIRERLQHRDLAEARELVERLRRKQPLP